jgi:hypothetical protein
MPEQPHEYAVRERCADVGLEAEFEWLVQAIRKHGYQGTHGQTTYTYPNLTGDDGIERRYWTMGSPLPETTILNRCPVRKADQLALRAAKYGGGPMKLNVRLPQDLYDQLHAGAEKQGMSLNTLILTLLAGAVRYRPTIEDQDDEKEASDDARRLA